MSPSAMCSTSDLEVRHGYTLGDLNQITQAALAADRLLAMDYAQRRDIAWSAIAEHLCSAKEPPHRQHLVRVGWQAIYRHVRDGLRERGYADGERDWTCGQPTMPRFALYWAARVEPSHEERIVERLAVEQVLAKVTGVYRDAVVALAVHDDYAAAANALGIKYTALTLRLTTARRTYLRHWHEGETPRRTARTDRRVESHGVELADHCGKGHEFTPENTYIRHRVLRGKPHRSRVCRACEHKRGQDRLAERNKASRLSSVDEGNTEP